MSLFIDLLHYQIVLLCLSCLHSYVACSVKSCAMFAKCISWNFIIALWFVSSHMSEHFFSTSTPNKTKRKEITPRLKRACWHQHLCVLGYHETEATWDELELFRVLTAIFRKRWRKCLLCIVYTSPAESITTGSCFSQILWLSCDAYNYCLSITSVVTNVKSTSIHWSHYQTL